MNLLDKLNWIKGPKAGDGATMAGQSGGPAFEGTSGDTLSDYRGRVTGSAPGGWYLLVGGPDANSLEAGSWFLALALIALGLFILLMILLGG